jgi:broad specificity phosphatase PhoE
MHLFLVRHGETEHNVAGLLAGVSDSRLTNHGVLQTQRLGTHLATHRNLRFTHIYASDLQRAYMTADEIRKNQQLKWGNCVPDVVKLSVLREQDFGSLELVPWASRRADTTSHTAREDETGFKPQETTDAMIQRAEIFLADHILPILATSVTDTKPSTDIRDCVAVVSRGLFLSVLWRTLLKKFLSNSISLGPGIEPPGRVRPLEYLPAWSNTGFLEATIDDLKDSDTGTTEREERLTTDPDISLLVGRSLIIYAVNGKDHLLNLKRTRGGVGSAAFDTRQKSIEGFFKRPKAP